MPGRVRLALRYMSGPELQNTLLRLAPWLVLGVAAPFATLFLTFLGCLGCVFAIPVGCLELPFVLAIGAWSFCTSIISLFVFAIQYARGLYAYFTKQPFTYVPYGVAQLDPENLVEFSGGQPLQVLRLDLSQQLLSRRVQASSLGCLTVFLLPFFWASSAFATLTNMILGSVDKQHTHHSFFAFVVGEPVDLERSKGFLDSLRRKYRERRTKKNRTVFILNTDPRNRDAITTSLQESLPGLTVQIVDDDLATKTLWRA